MQSKESGAITIELLVSASKSTLGKGETTEHFLKRITHLTLNNKKITRIDKIETCKNLRVLYLYDNKILSIANLSTLHHITHLHLQRNRISKLEGLETLVHLEKLYLEGNQISCLEGLQESTALQELHLSNQTFDSSRDSFSFDTRSLAAISRSLRVLNLSNCSVQDATPLQVLSRLEQLDLSRNRIDALEDVFTLVGSLRCLKELDLTNNHVNATPKYREKTIIFSNVALTTLDKRPIDAKQRSMMQTHLAYKHKKKQEKPSTQTNENNDPLAQQMHFSVSGNNNWSINN